MLSDEQMAEISLGDYRKKATLNRATHQIDTVFGDPEKKAHHQHKIAQRTKGLARADARTDAELEKIRQAQPKPEPMDPAVAAEQLAKMKARYRQLGGDSYMYADRMSDQDREAEQLHKAIQHLQRSLGESATAGATTSANVGTVISPQVKLGSARGKKSYIGSPGHSGTKAPPQPKVVQPKTSSGTAKNALDMKGANIFGAPIKR